MSSNRTATCRLVLSLALALQHGVLTGCSDEAEPDPVNARSANDSASAEQDNRQSGRRSTWTPSPDPSLLKVGGFSFSKPVTWIETPPTTSLRQANYSVPGRSGAEAAELAVFVFSGAERIELELHLERWRQQFQPDADGRRPEPEVERVQFNGTDAAIVTLVGSYMKPATAWFTPGQALVTAVFDTEDGQVMLRLTGPEETVRDALPQFRALIESGRRIADQGQSPPSSGR